MNDKLAKRSVRWAKIFPYVMLIPSLFLFITFTIIPFFFGAYTSFFRWDGIGPMVYIGVDNYWFTFRDELFWKSVLNSFIYAVCNIVFKNFFGICLALLVSKQTFMKSFFRTTLYMPQTFSLVVVGILWTWIYNPVFGLLNPFLEAIGCSGLIREWLGDPSIALFSVIWVDIWKTMGFCMILYLAGLNRIPQDLYEAADIDGANGFQKFLFITIPQLNSTLVLNTLMSMTSAFLNNYALVEAMTGGGPFNATEVALSYTVKTAFQFNTLGKANAMSMVLFLLVFTFGCIQLKTMTKDVYE